MSHDQQTSYGKHNNKLIVPQSSAIDISVCRLACQMATGRNMVWFNLRSQFFFCPADLGGYRDILPPTGVVSYAGEFLYSKAIQQVTVSGPPPLAGEATPPP